VVRRFVRSMVWDIGWRNGDGDGNERRGKMLPESKLILLRRHRVADRTMASSTCLQSN
jgi:hypothetical protein